MACLLRKDLSLGIVKLVLGKFLETTGGDGAFFKWHFFGRPGKRPRVVTQRHGVRWEERSMEADIPGYPHLFLSKITWETC